MKISAVLAASSCTFSSAPVEPPPDNLIAVDGVSYTPDVNALLFLEESLRLDGRSPSSIPPVLRPWGGPTLSTFWPPGDSRKARADADSTAWHFRANQMRIPSAVTNRFLSPAPLPEPFASQCTAPCRAARVPRFLVGDHGFDLLAAVNFAGALDAADALNVEVRASVAVLLDRAGPDAWSVEPPAARQTLLSVYTKGWLDLVPSTEAAAEFSYRRGEVIAKNQAILRLLQSTSSSSSN
ncbi:MAG: hypothetical protein AAFU77_16140 [Myxococcota bacterium]